MPASTAVDELKVLYYNSDILEVKSLWRLIDIEGRVDYASHETSERPEDSFWTSLQRDVWKNTTTRYKQREKTRKNLDTVFGFVFTAAMDFRSTALLSFLDMGFSPQGTWWSRFWFTPFDVANAWQVKLPSEEYSMGSVFWDDERSNCYNALVSRGSIGRGLGSTAEFHIFLAILSRVLCWAAILFFGCLVYFLFDVGPIFLSEFILGFFVKLELDFNGMRN